VDSAEPGLLLSATPGDRDPFLPICVLRDSSGQIRRIRSLRRATCRSAHGTVPAQAVSFVSPRVARASSSLSRLLQRAKEEWKWR
jgi:hypothetical protein